MGNLAGFFIFSFFFFFFMLGTQGVGASQDDSMKSRCGKHGPAVRFPFWLRDHHQQDHCCHPGLGFMLSCTEKNDTVLELPFSVKLFVEKIDYKRHLIHAYDPNGCLPKQLPNLNLSASPFQYDLSALPSQYIENYTLFSCPSPIIYSTPIPCLSFPGNQVHAIRSDYPIIDIPLSSCSKLSKLSYIRSVPYEVLYTKKYIHLNWSNPLCGNRQAAGKSTETKSECFDISERSQRGSSHKLIITGANLGFFLIVLVVIGVYFVWNRDKIDKENQVKIEKFLEDYKALKPTRYSYADIKRITHQFKDKLGQGGHGTVYKGNLSDEIFVAVKILNFSNDNGEEFINEVGTMGTIHHVNVVRLVGFCADGFRRALVYEFLPNDSLEKLIFKSSGKANSLGWEKLQDIALGIAKGIEYLHQGCDQRILHFDIKPHNILLGHNFNPKISDFGLAKLCSKEQSIVSMTTARGTMGYIAPEVFSRNFGSVSYKSDVYSFGMVLLEMVGGRKNTDTTIQNTSQVYFPEWIYNRLDHGEEIEIQIEEEQDSNIARKLAIVGLWCIQWYPVDRPSMRAVVQMLEGDGESLTIPPNPFAPTNSMKTSAIMHGRPLKKELEAIVEIE